MPNHCENSLIMSSATLPVILENYITKNEKGEKIFDFELIEPIGEVPNWYDKRRKKWGTKWAGYDLCIGEDNIDFFTAWSPPVPIITKLAELHKDLVFRLEYYELGDAFRGTVTAKWNGKEVSLEHKHWNMTDKDFIELGFEDFIEKGGT